MKGHNDRRYLSLQFWKKVHEKNGSEFQSFFSDIMEKANPDFQKVKPYGNMGDGGNDGYIPSKGIYYQVYAPENPTDRSTEAAKKMVDDFNKLKSSNWSEVSNIREYYFVFNDKNSGLDSVLESARAKLRNENINITIEILVPRKLEETLLGLNSNQLIALDFDVDQRKALEVSREYLKGLEVELDRGHANYVNQTLEVMRHIVSSQGDETLLLDFELIYARTLQRLEKVPEAKKKYEDLYLRYPRDVRAPLYLAEMYAITGDYINNKRVLDEVKVIDSSHWLYSLEILVRKSYLKETISINEIDTNAFPNDPKIKSDYYRLYGSLLMKSMDFANAGIFIERALYFNPEKLANYDTKIGLEINKLVLENNEEKKNKKAVDIFKEIKSTIDKFTYSGNIGIRNQVYLNYKQAKVMLLMEDNNLKELASILGDTFELVLLCHFDIVIEGILTDLMADTRIPKEKFKKILIYLINVDKDLSDDLAKNMFLQFLDQETLETEGKEFYKNKKLTYFVSLIDDLENKNYDNFVEKVKVDHQFVVMSFIAICQPDLRKKLIDSLPDTGEIDKNRLNLLLEDEAGNIDGAFEILKKLDLSTIGYFDSWKFIEVAKKKDAWDFVLIFGEKILSYVKETDRIVRVKLELFNANLNLGRLPEAVLIGEEILENKVYKALLDVKNKNNLLCQTVNSLLWRNTAHDNNRAIYLIETYREYLNDFKSNALLASEVYLRQKDVNNALKSIVRGVVLVRRPSPEEYAELHMVFTKIENIFDIKLTPDSQIQKDRFVQVHEDDGWYYVGDGEPLDAQLVPLEKQSAFIGKKVGDKIILGNEYISNKKEKTIKNILPIEKYIMWQTYYNFEKLSVEGMWSKAVSIDVPHTEDGAIDLKNIIAHMKDQQERGQEFFNYYCDQKNIPFALLAVAEGGIVNAIGRIRNEQRGFIRMTNGSLEELISQQDVVEKIISNKEPFYLDGTSAWVLAETGLLIKIIQYIPKIKVPQSVIGLLFDIKEKLSYKPGQVGQMVYSNGKLEFFELNTDAVDLVIERISETVELLEGNSAQISVISLASKVNVFSEKEIPPYLTDAAIMAQKENVPILTEDFLYLHMNEVETQKLSPQYFSSIVLIRALYQQDKISFKEYLEFFSFLAFHRFNFLQIRTQDLEKALFEDSTNKDEVQLDNLNKFNLPLTLSLEYGADSVSALNVIVELIHKLLLDRTVSEKVLVKIYIEIISKYPTDKSKNVLGKEIMTILIRIISENRNIVIESQTYIKFNALMNASNGLN